jgi:hypothetical protein
MPCPINAETNTWDLLAMTYMRLDWPFGVWDFGFHDGDAVTLMGKNTGGI